MIYPSPQTARCSVCQMLSWRCPHAWHLRYAQDVCELGVCVTPPRGSKEFAAIERQLSEREIAENGWAA